MASTKTTKPVIRIDNGTTYGDVYTKDRVNEKLNTKQNNLTDSNIDLISLDNVGTTLTLLKKIQYNGVFNTYSITDTPEETVSTYTGAYINSLVGAKYTKPSDGIPSSDLAAAVKTSLGKADTALQKVDITTGSTNGTISVKGTNIAVKGLAALAYKASLGKADVGLGNVENKTMDTAVTASSGNYISSGAVKTYVDSKISGITKFDVVKYESFDKLPTTGTKGTIYLVPHSHGTSDSYDEYIWNTAITPASYEKIGNTDIDLSGYVPTSRKVNGHLLTSDINLIPGDVGVNETNFPGLKKVGTVTSITINGVAQPQTGGVVALPVVTTNQYNSDMQDLNDRITNIQRNSVVVSFIDEA